MEKQINPGIILLSWFTIGFILFWLSVIIEQIFFKKKNLSYKFAILDWSDFFERFKYSFLGASFGPFSFLFILTSIYEIKKEIKRLKNLGLS